MTNYKPHAEARDKAFWSRACLIEFSLRFVENPKEPNERQADPNLKETLQQEGSGILAWLVGGCLSFQRQGLNIPASVQLATDKYRDEEDRLLLFIQECCLVKPEASVKGSAFYEAYKKWCEDNQMGRALSGKDFGQEMKKRFPKSSPSNGRIIYHGVGLLAPDDDPQPRSLFDAQEQATSNEKRESVEGASFPSTVNKSALEANRAQEHAAESRGSEGHGHKLSQNHRYAPSYRGVLGKHPLHPLHPHPVTISQRASEAEGQEVESQKALSPDPLLTNSQVASEAEAQQVEDQKVPSTDPLLEEVWEDETL